jgi:hypothetical protein
VTTLGMPKQPLVLAAVPAILFHRAAVLRCTPGLAEHAGVHQPVNLALMTNGTITTPA